MEEPITLESLAARIQRLEDESTQRRKAERELLEHIRPQAEEITAWIEQAMARFPKTAQTQTQAQIDELERMINPEGGSEPIQ